MEFLQASHSHWRWIVLGLVLVTALKLLASRFGSGRWTDVDATLILASRISAQVQLLMGLILYVVLAKWSDMRFTGEHALIALAAVAALEVGGARARRAEGDAAKLKEASTGFAVGLILVAVVILLRMV